MFELLIVTILRNHNDKIDFESDHEDDGSAVNKKYVFKRDVSWLSTTCKLIDEVMMFKDEDFFY